jgi:hypothetical protein
MFPLVCHECGIPLPESLAGFQIPTGDFSVQTECLLFPPITNPSITKVRASLIPITLPWIYLSEPPPPPDRTVMLTPNGDSASIGSSYSESDSDLFPGITRVDSGIVPTLGRSFSTFVSESPTAITPISCPSVVPKVSRSAPPNPVRFLSQNHNSFPSITAPKPTRRHANQPSTTSLHRQLRHSDFRKRQTSR